MSKAKFAAAKELIAEKRYAEARAILKTINHPTAREWEARLDQLETRPTPKHKRKPARRRPVLFLIAILLGLCTIMYLIGSSPELQKAGQASLTARAIAQVATDDAQHILDQQSTATIIILSTLVTYTPSPTITDTMTPSVTFTSSPYVSSTPQITILPLQTYYITKSANARTCPDINCESLGQFIAGQTIEVDGIVHGSVVNGSSTWYRTQYTVTTAYIHSSLASLAVDRLPTQPVSAPISSGGVSCGGATTCGEMTSCAQAYACLRAGRASLDRDKDGVPCESICSGG